jgi:hypothetical protein
MEDSPYEVYRIYSSSPYETLKVVNTFTKADTGPQSKATFNIP